MMSPDGMTLHHQSIRKRSFNFCWSFPLQMMLIMIVLILPSTHLIQESMRVMTEIIIIMLMMNMIIVKMQMILLCKSGKGISCRISKKWHHHQVMSSWENNCRGRNPEVKKGGKEKWDARGWFSSSSLPLFFSSTEQHDHHVDFTVSQNLSKHTMIVRITPHLYFFAPSLQRWGEKRSDQILYI